MDERGVMWMSSGELVVRDGDKLLFIQMGKLSTARAVNLLRFAADALAEDRAYTDAQRAECDDWNARLEARFPAPKGRAAIRAVPDAS